MSGADMVREMIGEMCAMVCGSSDGGPVVSWVVLDTYGRSWPMSGRVVGVDVWNSCAVSVDMGDGEPVPVRADMVTEWGWS